MGTDQQIPTLPKKRILRNRWIRPDILLANHNEAGDPNAPPFENLEQPIDDGTGGANPFNVYRYTYTYDVLGNRLTKTDHVNGRTTTYHYDVNEPDTAFASNNNRLQWYEVFEGSTLIEQVMYLYDEGGNVAAAVRKPAADPTFQALRMDYDSGGLLWIVQSYQWEFDAALGMAINVQRTAVREFVYEGGGRARYLVQDRDPADPDLAVIPGSQSWSDYDGEAIYADYLVDTGAQGFTEVRSYLPGVSQTDVGQSPTFVHGNHIGTMRAVSDSGGAQAYEVVYTAFGEPVSSSGTGDTRYGYVGEHGYEEDLIPGWDSLHVGARWYEPSTGRFLQRDPIGIRGGMNVYAYAESGPVLIVDALGLRPNNFWSDIDDFLNDAINGPCLGWTGVGIVSAGAANYKYRMGVGRVVNRSGVVAAGTYAGWNVGKALDTHWEDKTGKSLSDRIGDGLFRLCPWCW